MKSKKETFGSLMDEFQYHFDKSVVFDDLLTLVICAFGQNPRTKKSYDEDLYLQTIGKYKKHKLVDHFPKMLACLVMEMEAQLDSSMGNDVLGTYYEQNLIKKGSGQFFTPWPICEFMAQCTAGDKTEDTLRILDPCCGSGRMLLCGAKHTGRQHEYYGIDIDHTCVKMTAINLFLNGIFHSEVMCADALDRDDFRMSYRISQLPFGVFRITDRERSPLWQSYRKTFPDMQKAGDSSKLILPSGEEGNTPFGGNASQLHLF